MANGGIIGPTNVTSFGKNKVTTKTASTSPSALTTQPGTRTARMLLVAGGGAGGGDGGGGGGAGGVICQEIPVAGGSALGALVIGGGAAETNPVCTPATGIS